MNTPIFKTRGPLDPVNDSEIYAPRPELDQILRAAYAPTVDAYLAILGSRQTGKSTLLYQVRHKLRARGYGIALLDLSLIREQPENEMYGFIASQILSELEVNLPRKSDKRDAPALPSNPIEFRKFLFDVARLTRAPRIVVLIDEVEAVPTEYSDGFFGTLRNIFSSRRKEDEIAFEKYLIVFCGAKELHRLTNGPNSPLNIAERIYLQDLNLEGVRSLVKNFKRINISAPEQTAQWIFDQTSGHPYLTQKLCANVEQQAPASIAFENVQHAAREFFKGDDHLEKLIAQIDAEEPAAAQLKEILNAHSIQFSRIKPEIARLELLGAIRDVEHRCVVRNAIYLAAFRTRFDIPEIKPKTGLQRVPIGRTVVAAIAIALLLFNLPLIWVYANDILFVPQTASEVFSPPDLPARAIIRHDSVIRANATQPSVITVELDEFTVTQSITVTLHHVDPDISVEGDKAWYRFDPPAHREKFSVLLHQSGLVYNPFNPTTPTRHVSVLFDLGNRIAVSHEIEFHVDAYSTVVVSIFVSLASVLAAASALWGNVQKARDLVGNLIQAFKQSK